MIQLFRDTAALNVVTILLSVAAAVVSLLSLFLSKRQLVANAITANRIEWIRSVRGLLSRFLDAYMEDGEESGRLKRSLSVHIQLYLRHDAPAYRAFLDALDQCVRNPFDQEDCRRFVWASQDMLGDVWNRMKREAGISRKSEERLRKKLEGERPGGWGR